MRCSECGADDPQPIFQPLKWSDRYFVEKAYNASVEPPPITKVWSCPRCGRRHLPVGRPYSGPQDFEV